MVISVRPKRKLKNGPWGLLEKSGGTYGSNSVWIYDNVC